MNQSLLLSFFTLFGILMSSSFAQESEIFLTYPELKDKVAVSLPEGHDPQKRYPVVFYYSGLGGQPDTSLIRFHTGPKDWIVVGMAYLNEGRTSLDKESLAKEMAVFHKVKKHVVKKYGANISECYVAGFSKGGWLVDVMLQTELSLAGGMILGAGNIKNFNKVKAYPLTRENRPKKAIFIGVGKNDVNYTYAFHSLLMHRRMGAAVTMEVWEDLGHSIPELGSPALKQWLQLRLPREDGLKETAEKEVQQKFESASKLPKLQQYLALRSLSTTPYVKLLGESWKKRIDERLSILKKDDTVKAESLAYALKQNTLYREIKYKNSADLERVKRGYLSIKKNFPKSKEAKMIASDVARVDKLMMQVIEREEELKQQRDQAREKRKTKGSSRGPSRRGFPVNPLIR